MTDNRHKVAIYTIVRSRRDELALSLIHSFCVECGWVATEYVDRRFPKDDDNSAWARLLSDISQHKYYAVVMAWHSDGLLEYCEQYGTHLAEINPFAMVGNVPMGKKVRLC